MRNVWMMIASVTLGMLAPLVVIGQEPIKATTFDEKRVLLYSDGTWKPALGDAGSASHLGAFSEPRAVTLLSRRKYNDYEKATFSFKHGIRDDPGLKITRNQWDLLFDNGEGGFTVGMTSGDRSRIVDVGELTWSELKSVPIVEALPAGARAGSVPAIQGHIYVVHTSTTDSDLYSVFRVDWLERGDQCAMSWVNVPSPEAGSADRKPK